MLVSTCFEHLFFWQMVEIASWQHVGEKRSGTSRTYRKTFVPLPLKTLNTCGGLRGFMCDFFPTV